MRTVVSIDGGGVLACGPVAFMRSFEATVAGNIRDVFTRLLIAGGLTPVVRIWFYSPTYTHAITWDELGTMFPGGGVVLQLHETFTIPALSHKEFST